MFLHDDPLFVCNSALHYLYKEMSSTEIELYLKKITVATTHVNATKIVYLYKKHFEYLISIVN